MKKKKNISDSISHKVALYTIIKSELLKYLLTIGTNIANGRGESGNSVNMERDLQRKSALKEGRLLFYSIQLQAWPKKGQLRVHLYMKNRPSIVIGVLVLSNSGI